MSWWKRKDAENPPPDDINEARLLRAEAKIEYAELKAQAPFVHKLTQNLIRRRMRNHFGDDLQITFTRK